MVILEKHGVAGKAADELLGWIEKLSRKSFRPYQRTLGKEVLVSILGNQGRRFTVLWARQVGKTEFGMLLILGLLVFLPRLAMQPAYRRAFPILEAYADGFLVGFVAPKLDTARIPFKRLRRLVNSTEVQSRLAGLGIRVTVASSQELALSNGSSAIALSGAAFQEGHTLHTIWFEETQQIQQYALRKVFDPMLAATNGTAIEVGTAGGRKCAFLDDIEANQRLSPGDHSHLTWRDIISVMRREAPGDPWTDRYEAYVQRKLERLPGGEMSESYRQNYLLEWILKAYQLISWEQWQRLKADGQGGRPHFRRGQFTPGAPRVFGLDTAKTTDSTVCTAGEVWSDHVRLVDWLELQGVDYVDQLEVVQAWARERGGEDPALQPDWVIDSTGAGDPVTDMYRHALRARVYGLTYTSQSKDALYKTWQGRLPSNRRAPSVLYAQCDSGDPEFQRFELQFLNCEVETRGNLIAYHHPEEEDEDLGSEVNHDDYVDSAFNLLHAASMPRASFTALSFRPPDPPERAEETDEQRHARHLGHAVAGAMKDLML